MFTKLIQPILGRIYPCTVEEVHHSTQKEKRIIDTLEPVLNQHRLVIDRKVIQSDYSSSMESSYGEKAHLYQAFHQMTRITKERGSIAHDDRLEALAMAVGYWVESMSRDTDKAAREMRDSFQDDAIKKFIRASQRSLMGPEDEPRSTWMSLRN